MCIVSLLYNISGDDLAVNYKKSTLLKTASIVLLFVVFVLILVVANLIASLEGDPYLSFFERLQPAFYVRTVLILAVSSLLYTPISYGVSNIIYQNSFRETQIHDLFYLFLKPDVLLKAILLRLLIWVVRGFYQLLTLLCGIVLETVFCLIHLAAAGESILDLSVGQLPSSICIILEYKSFKWLSVILWISVLCVLIITHLRFMLCKYALIQYEELSAIEAIRIGRLAMSGRFFMFCFRVLQNYSYYILLIGSFGLARRFLKKRRGEPFMAFAMRLVSDGRRLYFIKKMKCS